MRLHLASLIAIFLLTFSSRVRAQSTAWDSLLTNSQWYVPSANLLAYVAPGTDLSNPQAVADQTIWTIPSSTNGIFTGTSVATFTLGPLNSTSTTTMNGLITDAGQIRIAFTGSDGNVTVGLGQEQTVDGNPLLEMQMITSGGSGGGYITHWAYMAPYNGDSSSLPPLEPETSLLSPQWNWMPGTTWSFADPSLFGPDGTGTFQVDDYRSGYFWGTGTGPAGSSAESFTLIGSATPEGDVLFNILSNGTLTSLTGQITGDASNSDMALRIYDPSTGLGSGGTATLLAVPEPSTWLLLFGGLSFLVTAFRRSRSGLKCPTKSK